jgi:hypothetical protein
MDEFLRGEWFPDEPVGPYVGEPQIISAQTAGHENAERWMESERWTGYSFI